jgi:RND family efflux transporter MFP subunit
MLKKASLPIVIIIFSLAVAAWLTTRDVTPATMKAKPPVMLVDVMQAESATVHINVNAQGTAAPRTRTTLVSEVSGLITDVASNFLAGGFFKKGDVLVKIDDRNYRADLKRAEASVASARSNLEKETGLAEYAARDWQRAQSSIASKREATSLALREPQMAEARAELEFALADLERRKGDLDRTVIRAPYNGMVREKLADIGQFVGTGTQLAITFAVDNAEIRLPLPDTELPFIRLPTGDTPIDEYPEVQLSAEIGGSRQVWNGHIVRSEGVFDDKTRVLYLVAQVTDPYNQVEKKWDEPLRFGTFLSAEIIGEKVPNIIVLPRTVLRNGDQVWTVNEEDKLESNTVEILRADENSIYIQSGLNPDQLVCTTLIDNPLPGLPVRYSHAAK